MVIFRKIGVFRMEMPTCEAALKKWRKEKGMRSRKTPLAAKGRKAEIF